MHANATHTHTKNTNTHPPTDTGNLDFENLSRSLYDVWLNCGRANDNHLSRAQLEHVCEQVGLHARIARKVAEEVFEKLGLGADGDDQRVSFADFIALIQGDGDASTTPTTIGSSALLDASASSSSSLGALRSVASQPHLLRGCVDDYVADVGGCAGTTTTSKESTDTSSVAMMLMGGQEETLMGHAAGLCQHISRSLIWFVSGCLPGWGPQCIFCMLLFGCVVFLGWLQRRRLSQFL